ncbi:hypothetical protein ACUMO5_004498 [Vibrio parahaemolyticus]|nr:hypothetical protein [Vibrio parahaemolyticus]EIC2575716.1 hypothetical protein [Vibrio parahaemolyticus]EID0039394.1 hypothetical protein [Vibrio parahaemolyticus]ELA9364053.1 hypothetical protein [Vibrio parahaemolyticus]MBM4914571.1 hypothetical protein [Vibrio parahaemolyticus]
MQEKLDIVGNKFEAPKSEQWLARDKIMLELNRIALEQARESVGKGENYLFGKHEGGYFQHQYLTWELENCFRCGNWLASISIAAAMVETFLHSYLNKGKNSRQLLESINFPCMDLYKELIDMRNSIMHLRNTKFKQSAYSLSDEELYERATKFMWLAYFLKDYVLFYSHSNE